MGKTVHTMNDSTDEIMRQAARDIVSLNTPDALLTSRQVALLMGYVSRNSIPQILKDPTFPSPIHITLSSENRWRCREVKDWIEARRKEFSPM